MFDAAHFLKSSAAILETNVIAPLAREVNILEVFLASQENETPAVKILRSNYALALDSLQQLRIVASNYRQAAAAKATVIKSHADYVDVMAAFERQRQEAKEALRNRNELWHIEIVKPDDSDKDRRQNES